MLPYLLMLQTKSSILRMQISESSKQKNRAGDGKLLNFNVGLIDRKKNEILVEPKEGKVQLMYNRWRGKYS